jgi:ceramide glucosyltransferase
MSFALIPLLCVGIAVVGCFYTVAAWRAVAAFRSACQSGTSAAASAAAAAASGITVLKPLHGAEPELYENLLSFLDQDHAGPVQVVFGVCDASDPARTVVERLMRDFPDHDMELVVGIRHAEGNGKIANLSSMSAAIRYPVVILSDSDIRVDRSYLRLTCAALAEPGVGLVTCLYRGGSDASLWSRLSAMAIDFHFFPSVLLGLRLGKARPCMGATMAMTSHTLDAIGGFRAFAGHLADDYAIGEAVRAAGQRVVVAQHLVEHRCNEGSAGALFLHELRWARTIRSIDPWGYAGSVVAHPLPFALAGLLTDAHRIVALAVLVATVLCRLLLQREVERTMAQSTSRRPLGPLRDLLSFAVFCASFITDVVEWRGRRYRVRADGTMEELKGVTS